MQTDKRVQQRVSVESHTEPSNAASSAKAAADAADAARSAANILEWKSYLPAECVESMIAMGWDIST